MKGKSANWLYSVVGVVALLIIVIAINVIAGIFKIRTDLTQNHLYTLTDGTKRILDKLDTDVEIRFYFSRDVASMPVPLRTYAQNVQDLLAEYQQNSHGRIKIIKLDPKPDSEAEDSANLDGIEGQDLNSTDKIFLGLSFRCLDSKQAIGFLSPDRANLLEYDISRAISSVSNPKKSIIGVMSALPVTGHPQTPMMMMQRQQPTPPWVFLQELKQNYQVKEVPLTTEKIDDDIAVLVLVHPKGITEGSQYAIDQFLLRGGKMVALLDPYSYVEIQTAGQYAQGEFSSTLDKLLPAWGIEYSPGKVLADPEFATQIQQQGEIQSDPTILSVTEAGINKQDALGASLSDLLFPFAGAFIEKPVEGLKGEVLIKSSRKAGLVDAAVIQGGNEAVRRAWKSADTEYPIALRLSGKFKTAFPTGKPTAKSEPKAESKPETAVGEPLKEAKADGVVILIGDADFAYDAIAGRSQQIANQTFFQPSNGNLNLIQSSVEQLAGDSNLIGIRSRSSANRPFEVVNKMQAAAEDKYQGKIDQLQTSLDEARQKLAALQTNKQLDQKTLLSPEQQAEIKKFHENEASVSQELKQVRKNLRQEIDALQNNLKWINIAAMPILVTVAGLALAWIKRQKRAAR
jgi:gliding motility-associatede transport system auxiliary component